MIEEYSFGRMVVDDKTYNNDLKIFPDKVKGEWWRLEGHRLQLADMEDVTSEKPKTIIVGRGYASCMVVDEEVKKYCKEKNIELVELPTAKAMKKFNEMAGPGVIGLFHLTC
jgi:hypothetical protein